MNSGVNHANQTSKQMAAFCSGQSVPHTLCMQQRIKSAAENMIAMDTSIYNLFKEGVIDRHTAVAEAVNPEIMAKRLNLN